MFIIWREKCRWILKELRTLLLGLFGATIYVWFFLIAFRKQASSRADLKKIGTYIVNVFDSLYCKNIAQSINLPFEIFDIHHRLMISLKNKNSTVEMCLEFLDHTIAKKLYLNFLCNLSQICVYCVFESGCVENVLCSSYMFFFTL